MTYSLWKSRKSLHKTLLYHSENLFNQQKLIQKRFPDMWNRTVPNFDDYVFLPSQISDR